MSRKYSSYRHKEGVLFLLINHETEKILAISTDKEYVLKYMAQFPVVFNRTADDYEIVTIVDKYKINKLYTMFSDTLFLEEFVGGVILTTLETKYYVNKLTEVYSNIKTMIGQLLLNETLINMSSEELLLSNQTFHMYYGKCNTFQDFISNISMEAFIRNYLVDPTICKESLELDDSYKNSVQRLW